MRHSRASSAELLSNDPSRTPFFTGWTLVSAEGGVRFAPPIPRRAALTVQGLVRYVARGHGVGQSVGGRSGHGALDTPAVGLARVPRAQLGRIKVGSLRKLSNSSWALRSVATRCR